MENIESTITNEKEYEEALEKIYKLMHCEPNTPESAELLYLCSLVERYEEENYPLD